MRLLAGLQRAEIKQHDFPVSIQGCTSEGFNSPTLEMAANDEVTVTQAAQAVLFMQLDGADETCPLTTIETQQRTPEDFQRACRDCSNVYFSGVVSTPVFIV